MGKRLKRIAAWCLVVFGTLLALISVIPAEGESAEQGATAIMVIGVLLALAGIVLLRGKRKSANYAPALPVKSGKPAGYSTKNCPECEERLPLDAESCPECGKKQREDDCTCSGGVESAAKARSYFAKERSNAKKVKSPGYIWRTAGDGSVCERCAANNGHEFSWDKEPPGGHAGAKARCRCYPETIVPRE